MDEKAKLDAFSILLKALFPKSSITLFLRLILKYINQEEYNKGEALRSETGFLLHRLEQSVKKA